MLAVSTAREHGRHLGHPCSRDVYTGTDLKPGWNSGGRAGADQESCVGRGKEWDLRVGMGIPIGKAPPQKRMNFSIEVARFGA